MAVWSLFWPCRRYGEQLPLGGLNEWVEKCELLDPDSKTRQEVGQLDDGLLAELRKEYASVDECADTQRNAKMSLSIRRSLGYYLLIAVFVALVKGGALLGQRFRYRGNGETLN